LLALIKFGDIDRQYAFAQAAEYSLHVMMMYPDE